MNLMAMLGFESLTDPVDTSAQAHPTQQLEQEESSETTFMVIRHVNLSALCC
jgi:hypothetical protein